MSQIFAIALHILKSINGIVLGSDVEPDLLRKTKESLYTYMFYHRM